MNDFWKSYDITHAEYGADYRCYPLYGTVHLMELAISLAFIVGAALWYRRSSARTRRRILVGVTALLLLDEVTTGLDLSVQARVLDLIRKIKAKYGISILLVSHDLAVIRMLADRTIVMLDGKIIESGLTDQILEDPQHAYTQQLVHSLL